MSGELTIVRFVERKNLYVRFYDRKKQAYVSRSLGTSDLSQAIDKAIKLWQQLSPLIEAGVSLDASSLEDCVRDYLQSEQVRVDAGEVLPGMLRDKTTQLRTFLIYCKLEGVRQISDVRPHSFNSFVQWRRDKSQKITNGKDIRLKRASLNKSIREVRAFFKHLRKKRVIDFDIELSEVSTRHEEVRTTNIAYTDEHWAAIEKELVRRSKDIQGQRREHTQAQQYFRVLFKTFMQVMVHAGTRPTELTNKLEWRDITFLELGKTPTDQALCPECTLNIRNPRGKGSRITACDAGMFLKLWARYVNEWRKANGFQPVKKTTLVFANPAGNKAFVYGNYAKHWNETLETLGLQGLGYTIRSARGYYVTRMLALGHSPYMIAKNCGHSPRILETNYEQLSAADLIAQFCEN